MACVAVAFAMLAFAACRTKRPSIVYRLDSETRGWVVIVYSRPEAPPLPKQGDAFLIEVPKSGVVSTSTKSPVGSASDTFLVRYPDNREEPLPSDAIQTHHLGRTMWENGKWLEHETFFLGTRAELDSAETEDQALSRIRADFP
jgi:hypothetical protein